MLSLRHEAWALELAPEAGGAVTALRWQGIDVLRPASTGTSDPLAMAAFPLVPFAGRIARGRFTFDGVDVRLPADPAFEPHALHGQGWRRPWQVEHVTAAEALLSFEHAPGDWPWHYLARQHFVLHDTAFALTLELANLSARPMPAGLGWHPYFPAGDASIRADVRRHWPWSVDMTPGGPQPLTPAVDLRSWRAVAGLALDDVFDAGPSGAELRWPGHALTLQASEELRFLVAYTPADAGHFCVEPISHAPDAVNNPRHVGETGLRILDTETSLRAQVRLKITGRDNAETSPHG